MKPRPSPGSQFSKQQLVARATSNEGRITPSNPVSPYLSYKDTEEETPANVSPCDIDGVGPFCGLHFKMPKRRSSEIIPTELPPCEGPKLQLFEHHNSPIEWLERLDIDRDEDAVTEGYVFRAKVRGREYAIKLFKFYNPMTTELYWGPLIGRNTPLEVASYYTDPFYSECRAYGRIQQLVNRRKMRANIAIPCHGFFFLKDSDERNLGGYNLDFELDRVDLRYQQSTAGGCRIRAIVKDIASPQPGVTQRDLYKTLTGITSLNRHKIYNMDIGLDNYRDGQIVDFGSSWTEPHKLLDALDGRAAEGSRLADRVGFDRMIRTEKIPNPKGHRGMPDLKYLKRLRPRKP